MIPTHIIFHKIRKLTLNITSTNNIDILSVFYEHVGRFLLNDPDYKDLMREMIEMLRETSKRPNLKINDKLAINNLLLIVEPPTTKVKSLQTKPELSPKSQFIQRLIRVELNNTSLPLVVNLSLAHPELINYDNIPALAAVLEAYFSKYKKIVVYTVDTTIENIIRGLELNDYRMNRVRMAQVKFVAEMYNHRVINFKLINDLLYRILCFGHPNNQPLPDNWDVEIDLPDNYFRIQLCCLLLNNLKSIFIDTDIPSKKKAQNRAVELKKRNDINKDLLGVFITFLQYYLFCKEKPLPVELDFKLNDLFAKYKSIPTVKRYDTLQEIGKRLQESIQRKREAESYLDNSDEALVVDDDDDDEDVAEDYDNTDDIDLDEDEGDEEDEDDEDDESEEDNDEESEREDDTSDIENNGVSEEDRMRLEAEKKFMDDLDKEYQKILIDSYDKSSSQTSSNRKKLLMPTPRKYLLKKPNIKQLQLPSDTKFAESVLKEKEISDKIVNEL
ncbi:MIF4G domain family protein [Candida albicans]|uniref:MIF4G domain family protein n=1 Tax=Candida albicans TaxID=5476 RepID=A0A8H6F1B9_CANAX|nr:MIF4G domain family protein [Candida albicans]